MMDQSELGLRAAYEDMLRICQERRAEMQERLLRILRVATALAYQVTTLSEASTDLQALVEELLLEAGKES